MLFERYGTFTGGIDLPADKRQTMDLPIQPAPLPRRLRVPLSLGGAPSAEPVVSAGQYVTTGERIAEGRLARSCDVFAPLAGRVEGIGQAWVADRGGFVPSPSVDLVDLTHPAEMSPAPAEYDFRQASRAELADRVRRSGLSTGRLRTQTLRDWLDRSAAAGVSVLILNGLEQQPLVTADHRLMVEHGPEVVRGMEILARALGVRRKLLAVDQRWTDAYRELVGPARLYDITCVALPPKYPAESDSLLVKVLTRRQVPLDGSPRDVGVAVVGPSSCWALCRRICSGVPQTARVVTVAGDHAPRPGNYYVPFGMDCGELVGADDRPVIHGGPMVGYHLTGGAVVGPSTNALLAMDESPPAVPTPCIRCGWCTSHCPARLNVSALNDAFELGDLDRAHRLGARACLACGTCSYICPARLPLAQRVKQLLHLIAQTRRTGRRAREGRRS